MRQYMWHISIRKQQYRNSIKATGQYNRSRSERENINRDIEENGILIELP